MTTGQGFADPREPASHPDRVVLLGPQAHERTVVPVLDELGLDGPVGLITAGWREWEGDPSRIDPDLTNRAVHLPLYAAAERVWNEDPELRSAHRAMQSTIRALRRVYNVRLAHALQARDEITKLHGNPDVLREEEAAVLESVRALDARHAERVRATRMEYDQRFHPGDRPAVRDEMDRLRPDLRDLQAIVVEGGHVAVLLNRLRLFGGRELLAGRTIVACSGAAMVMAPRLVLFHDSPPQGPGHPELQEAGLGLYPDVIPMPHADKRLKLHDTRRMARFAERFAPSPCVLLEADTRLEWTAQGWEARSTRRIHVDGTLVDWRGAA